MSSKKVNQEQEIMLFYEFLQGLDGHPTLYGDEEERVKAADDPLRARLWNASLDGDKAATAALIDWYQEHGIYEKKDEP